MLLEQIRSELETAEELPGEALAEAVAQAPALAPEILALLDKAADGVYLLPRQQNLLFCGLFALAAAHWTEACRPFLAMLRQPERRVEAFFGDGLTEFCTQLLLSFYDEDPEPLFAALEDRATASGVRWALFQVLARLCWEGRIPRDRVVALLDRFDREEWAPPDDDVWMGWEEAIALLGLKEFEPRVKRGWDTGRFSFNKEDHEEWLSQLNRAAADPRDPAPFTGSKVVPVTDPVASLAWLAWREPDSEDFEDEDSEAEDGEDEESDAMPDPAEAIRLSDGEIRWLDGFLGSGHVAPDALTLEELDGFFTALAIGPVMVPPSEYMKVVWGDGAPRYDSAEQAQLVTDLLSRHWNTITVRLEAMFPLKPLISPGPLEEKGREWAEGFTMGLDRRREEWGPIFDHKDAGTFVWTIMALIADDYDPEFKPISLEERAQILTMLPLSILGIAAFWSNIAAGRHTPARSGKIGRNQPCPCGSGRKHKKCCGAAA